MIVDLMHTEGVEQVAPNQFRKIKAGYPIDLYGVKYLVLKIEQCVKTQSNDDIDDLRIARIYLLKLTRSGAYSKAKDAFVTGYIQMSGKVARDFRIEADLSQKYYTAINYYNDVVRSGRNTLFIRNRFFDSSHQAGIDAERQRELFAATSDQWHWGL